MEQRAVFDHFALLDEFETAICDSLVEIVEGLEVVIDEGFVDEEPEVLCRL